MANHKFSWKEDANPDKKPTVAIVRYGAFGDTAQAASVCAAFKKAGYHVTFFASYPASEIIAFDPNIDRLITQLQDQIPMNWLGYYWHWMRYKWMGKGFDKWVNLTESVEGNLLALTGNVRFEWPARVRHELMNVNYLEHQHKLAEIPYEPSFKFHPTEDEVKWRNTERARMKKAGIDKFILWPLAGSSRTHKLYPHQDIVWKHIFAHYPTWGVVTCGDGSCADLEAGFDGEPRLWKTCGKWSIRQVLAMMELADIVCGPETGVLSCAAFYPMPKIVFLSHSTVQNLTRDWINTTSLWAPTTECLGRGKNEAPACHKMLPTFEGCRRHEVHGTAQCAAEIEPAWVWEHLQRAMNEGAGGEWFPPIMKL